MSNLFGVVTPDKRRKRAVVKAKRKRSVIQQVYDRIRSKLARPSLRGSAPMAVDTGATVQYARKSTGSDITNKYISVTKSQKLTRADAARAAITPSFNLRTLTQSQNDFDSPQQGIHTRVYFSKAWLQDLYKYSTLTMENQSVTVNTNGQYALTGQDFNSNIVTTATGSYHFRDQRFMIYGRKVIDRFTNSCANTLQFELFYMKTKTPLGTSTGNDVKPTSLYNLLDTMAADSAGSDNLFRNQSTINRRDPKTFGSNPLDYSGVRHYYKCFKRVKFTLKPGEQCNIELKLKGTKIVRGATYTDYIEYPGITYTLLMKVQASTVGAIAASGSLSATDCSVGSGQYQHISEYSAYGKYLANVLNFKGDSTVLPTILASNQEAMNVEDGQKDTTLDEL